MMEVVNVRTQYEWNEVIEVMNLKFNADWSEYKQDSCINISANGYADLDYYNRNGISVMSFEEWYLIYRN